MTQPISQRSPLAGWMAECLCLGLLWLSVAAAVHAEPAAAPAGPAILVVGDSLSAGYGIDRERGWVRLLERRLADGGYPHRVVNASISGDTSRGALARLPRALETFAPEIVVLELGGNDGLRALAPAELESNLAAMIELARGHGARVLLVGMRIPPNYGPAYTRRFEAVFPTLAQRYGVPLVPFLLAGVATDADLMQRDGVHPRAEAQPALLDNVWPALQPLLEATAS